MKTKALIFSIATNFIIVLTLYSQESYPLKKHEINFGYINLLDLNQNQNIGLGYKYYLKKGAIRASCNFYSIEAKNNLYVFIKEQIDGNNIKIGYEFHNNSKKLQFFYGFDILHTKTSKQANNDYVFRLNKKPYFRTEILTLRLGGSPFIGFKFFINKKFSISFEANSNILLQESKIYYIDDIFPKDLRTSKTSIGIIPNSLITINFHL